MDNKLTVKQYKIILDEFDANMAKQIFFGNTHLYTPAIEKATLQGILKQIINQSNNEQTESRQDS